MHRKFNLLSTANSRKLFLLKNANKLSLTQSNIKEEHSRSLRSNRKILLKEQRSHNNKFEKCFILKGIKLWNSLPEERKMVRNIFQFKTRAKSEMMFNKINFPE